MNQATTKSSSPFPVLLLSAAVAGALVAAVVSLAGDAIGSALEGPLAVNLRSWELVALLVLFVNIPGGAAAGLLGALSHRWMRGSGIGTALHAVLFLGLILSSDSLRAAPASVNLWVAGVGILAGACAGGAGGALVQGFRPPSKGAQQKPEPS